MNAGMVSPIWPLTRQALLRPQFPAGVNRAGLTFGQPLPVYPGQRTLSDRLGRSVSCQQETHAPQQTASLFDHHVGTSEQRRRNSEAHRLRSLEVDAQGKMRRLLDRQIGRTRAFEDAVGECRSTLI